MRSLISSRWMFSLAMLLVCSFNAEAALEVTNFTRTAAAVELKWNGLGAGMSYTVQFQERLEDGIWRLAREHTQFPLNTNAYAEGIGAGASSFYRVMSVPTPQRGKPLAVSFVRIVPLTELAFYYNAGLLPVPPQYAVRLYKVTYETVSPWGARVQATGALIIPDRTGTPFPLLSYQHGTVTQTNKAPSSMDLLGSEAGVGVLFATSGYAVALPDYLGLGDSPGLHPYHHAKSQATAAADLLRAVKTIYATNGFSLSDRLFLSGYSQGGHATMALLRELENWHTNEFTVTACAAMAGAYDLSGTAVTDFLSGRAMPNPYYFLYFLAAYQEVYRLAPSLADLLRAPYNSTLPPLLNGNTGGSDINAAMPADAVQILKSETLADFRANDRHPLRLALADNDVIGWKPRTPLRLYHCSGDLDVHPAHSQAALASFQSLGATDVQFIDASPGATHGGCTLPTMLSAKAWFDALR